MMAGQSVPRCLAPSDGNLEQIANHKVANKYAMEQQTFRDRFLAAAIAARDFARTLVQESLPDAMLFRVRLNSSFDGSPLRDDERAYPEDSSPQRARELCAVTEDVVVETLWRNGAIPEWVDVSVIGETGSATLVEVLVCGRFTAQEALLYHAREGRPPFHSVGPALPVRHKQGQRFSIHYRCESWNAADIDSLRQNRHKVWSLQLPGAEFDDQAIGTLPDLPGMEILELRDSPIDGSGFRTLARHPILRVLRLTLLQNRRFLIDGLPQFPQLQTLGLVGLPAQPWGFDQLARSLPALSEIRLESVGELVLGGEFPRSVSSVDLTGLQVVGRVSLPRRMDRVGIHLSGACGSHVEALLANVDEVRSLSLRGTSIDEATAMRLAARIPFEFFDIGDTGLSNAAIRRITTAYPRMRILPSI